MSTYASALPTFWVVLLVALAVLIMTKFMSNTATATTCIPIVSGLTMSLGENPLLLMVPATLAASMTFMLSVATPPNALVFSSGHITIPQMAKHGLLMNILSLFVITGISYGYSSYSLARWPASCPTGQPAPIPSDHSARYLQMLPFHTRNGSARYEYVT